MRCDAPWPHGLGLGQRDLSNELKPQLLELTSALMRSQEISEIDRLGLVGSKISKDAAMPRVHRRLELCPFGFFIFHTPKKPWCNRGLTHIWGHLLWVLKAGGWDYIQGYQEVTSQPVPGVACSLL